MRIVKLAWMGAALMLGSCVAVGAFAQADAAQPPVGRQGGRGQGRGGGGQFGGRGGGQLSLVNIPVDLLAKELKLTDDQKAAITKTRTKMQEDMQALMRPADGSQPDFREIRPKMQAINEQAAKDVDAVLKDDQKAEAATLVKNLQSLQALRMPIQTYSDLKLTTEQKTRLAALAADAMKDRAEKMKEMQAARQAGDQAKMQEIMTSLRGNGQPDEKGVAVLTAEQKELLTKYIKEHPPRGGRPGGLGAGANPAPQP